MNHLITFLRNLAVEDDGAQVIEYALIIAVVSIGLVVALDGVGGNFATFVANVGTCLTTGTCP